MSLINEKDDLGVFNEFLYENFKIDFREYARSSYSRRIERFMSIENINSISDLKLILKNQPNKVELFLEEVTVNTTEMFRDPEFWEKIRDKVIPSIASNETFRIWHAGCSSGREPFSMVIMLKEMGLLDNAKIVATDINNSILEKAKSGVFSNKEMEINKFNYLKSGGTLEFESYFEEIDSTFYLKKELIKHITFKKHDLVLNDEFSKFDLILCRNVMIYFDRYLQDKVYIKFFKSLFENGFFAIGRKETLVYSPIFEYFEEIDSEEKIYRIKDTKRL